MVRVREGSGAVRDQGEGEEVTAENIVVYVENTLIPLLNQSRVEAILAKASFPEQISASHRAHKAAMRGGVESLAIRLSERLRSAAWKHVWGGTQNQAFELSWVLAAVGMGIATVDLVGDGEYTIEDYIVLVEPWVSGFPDFPLPVKEEV